MSKNDETPKAGFEITANKGFHMKFDNGWTVSIQWGDGNYCSNRDYDGDRNRVPRSSTAEVAVWHESGGDMGNDLLKALGFTSDDSGVAGWVTPERVSVLISVVSSLPWRA